MRKAARRARPLDAPSPGPVTQAAGRPSRAVVSYLVSAATGARGAGVLARIERVAAAARADRVGIEDAEASAHQAVFVIDLRALEVVRAVLIDHEAHAALGEDHVVFGEFVLESHAVRHARAAARIDENAQRKLGILLLGHQPAQLLHRAVAHRDHAGLVLREDVGRALRLDIGCHGSVLLSGAYCGAYSDRLSLHRE